MSEEPASALAVGAGISAEIEVLARQHRAEGGPREVWGARVSQFGLG